MSTRALRKLSSPSTLREAVAQDLRNAIVAGELEPGVLLKETELALRLGVSATPVREAFVDLAAEGLVQIETHRLKRVTPIELPVMLDLVRVQSALWRMGYIWGFSKVGLAELRELDATVAAYKAALAKKDILAAIQAGHAFHTVFIAASGNSELLRVTLDRRALIARFILLRGASTISHSGLKQHQAMLEAFRRGDTADVLARLDQIAAKLIALAQG